MRSLIGFHILHIRGRGSNAQRKDAEADDGHLQFSNLGFFNVFRSFSRRPRRRLYKKSWRIRWMSTAGGSWRWAAIGLGCFPLFHARMGSGLFGENHGVVLWPVLRPGNIPDDSEGGGSWHRGLSCDYDGLALMAGEGFTKVADIQDRGGTVRWFLFTYTNPHTQQKGEGIHSQWWQNWLPFNRTGKIWNIAKLVRTFDSQPRFLQSPVSAGCRERCPDSRKGEALCAAQEHHCKADESAQCVTEMPEQALLQQSCFRRTAQDTNKTFFPDIRFQIERHFSSPWHS